MSATAIIVHEGVKLAVKVGIKQLKDALARNDNAWLEAAALQKEDILFEVQNAIEIHEAKLEDCLTFKEALALVRPLYEEAFKSAEPDRVSMLAHALVGLFRPDIAIELKSRVSRALTQLEASDVILLRNLRFVNDPEREKIYKERGGGTAFAPLIQAGCIYIDQAGFGGTHRIEVTPVGDAAIELLKEWVTAKSP